MPALPPLPARRPGVTRRNALTTLGLLAAAPLAAGSLAACSTGSTASTPTSAGSRLPSSPRTPVTVQFYYPVAVGGPLTKVVDALVADFSKQHPGITVQATYAGSYDETKTKVLAAATAGRPPDLAVLLSTELFTLTDQNLLLPYDRFAQAAADRGWLDSFYPAFLANSRTQDGITYGIPFQRSTIIQYYNKDLFTKARLDPATAPRTWDDVISSAKALTAAGVPAGIEIPSSPDFAYWPLQALTIQAGGRLANPQGTKVFFDAAPTRSALNYLVDLSHTHKVMPTGTIAWATTPQDFLRQRAGIIWTTTGNLTNIHKTATFNFGVSQLPSGTQPGSPTGGGNLYLLKTNAANREAAAYTLARWLAAPPQAARWSAATGYVATSPAAYDQPALTTYTSKFPAALVARDQLAVAQPELSTHDDARVTKTLDDAVGAAVTGQSTPAAALTSAQRRADQLLARYR